MESPCGSAVFRWKYSLSSGFPRKHRKFSLTCPSLVMSSYSHGGWQEHSFISACKSDMYVRYCVLSAGAFIRQVRRYARRHSLEFRYDPRRGKGSHGRIYLGNRLTTVKSGNKTIVAGLLHKMLKDLQIDTKDF